MLGKAVTEAHMRTCLYTSDQIQHIQSSLTPQEIIDTFKSMVSLNTPPLHPHRLQNPVSSNLTP